MTLRHRQLFRAGLTFVVVQPIRLGTDKTLEVGETLSVAGGYPIWRLRAWYIRGAIGVEGCGWAEQKIEGYRARVAREEERRERIGAFVEALGSDQREAFEAMDDARRAGFIQAVVVLAELLEIRDGLTEGELESFDALEDEVEKVRFVEQLAAANVAAQDALRRDLNEAFALVPEDQREAFDALDAAAKAEFVARRVEEERVAAEEAAALGELVDWYAGLTEEERAALDKLPDEEKAEFVGGDEETMAALLATAASDEPEGKPAKGKGSKKRRSQKKD